MLPPVLVGLDRRLDQVERDPARLVRDAQGRLEGGPVTVRDPATGAPLAAGRVLGLGPDGALRLAADGGERSLYAGEVTLAP